MTLRRAAAALLAIALVIGSTAPGALAQMDRLKSMPPAERAKLQTDMMKSKLSLTAEQTPKIAAINEKYAQQMQPVIMSSEGPLVRMRKMREISGAKEGELKAVLTPDQFQKYLAEKEEMREKFETHLAK